MARAYDRKFAGTHSNTCSIIIVAAVLLKDCCANKKRSIVEESKPVGSRHASCAHRPDVETGREKLSRGMFYALSGRVFGLSDQLSFEQQNCWPKSLLAVKSLEEKYPFWQEVQPQDLHDLMSTSQMHAQA